MPCPLSGSCLTVCLHAGPVSQLVSSCPLVLSSSWQLVWDVAFSCLCWSRPMPACRIPCSLSSSALVSLSLSLSLSPPNRSGTLGLPPGLSVSSLRARLSRHDSRLPPCHLSFSCSGILGAASVFFLLSPAVVPPILPTGEDFVAEAVFFALPSGAAVATRCPPHPFRHLSGRRRRRVFGGVFSRPVSVPWAGDRPGFFFVVEGPAVFDLISPAPIGSALKPQASQNQTSLFEC